MEKEEVKKDRVEGSVAAAGQGVEVEETRRGRDTNRGHPGSEGSRPRARQRGYDERIRPAHVIRNTIAPPIPFSCKICGKS